MNRLMFPKCNAMYKYIVCKLHIYIFYANTSNNFQKIKYIIYPSLFSQFLVIVRTFAVNIMNLSLLEVIQLEVVHLYLKLTIEILNEVLIPQGFTILITL